MTIKGGFGTAVTKAAVKPVVLEERCCLLGNKTAELIEESKGNPVPVNAVITRSQKRHHERRHPWFKLSVNLVRRSEIRRRGSLGRKRKDSYTDKVGDGVRFGKIICGEI